MRWFLLVFLLFLFLGGCQRDNVARDMRSLIQKGNFEEAVILGEMFLQENPSSPDAPEIIYSLMQAYIRLGDFSRAYLLGEKYLQRYPQGRRREKIEEWMGEVKERERKREERIEEEMEKLSRLYPELVSRRLPPSRLFLLLGHTYWEMGERENARKFYRKAIQLDSSLERDEVLRNRLGRKSVESLLEVRDESLRSFEEVWEGEWEESGEVKRFQLRGMKGVLVTGRVFNRGETMVRGVRLVVTPSDFYGKALDVRVTWLGDIYPGMARPFSVVFPRLEKKKIDRVEYLFLTQGGEKR